MSHDNTAVAPVATTALKASYPAGHNAGSTAKEAVQALVVRLAELFPATFVADWRQPHQPLAVGICKELIARNILPKRDACAALRFYTGRLLYQRALKPGGARIDLDGKPAGEVTEEQRAHAAIEVKRILRAVQARRSGIKPVVSAKPAKAPDKPKPDPDRITTTQLKKMRRELKAKGEAPKGTSLSNLRAGALARRQGEGQR